MPSYSPVEKTSQYSISSYIPTVQSSFFVNCYVPNNFTADAYINSQIAFQVAGFQGSVFQNGQTGVPKYNSFYLNCISLSTFSKSGTADSSFRFNFEKLTTANAFKNLSFNLLSIKYGKINSFFFARYQWTNTGPTKYGKLWVDANISYRTKSLYFYVNVIPSKNRTNEYSNYLLLNVSPIRNRTSEYSFYQLVNTIGYKTIEGSFDLSAEYSARYIESNWYLNANIQPNFGEPFTVDCLIREPEVSDSFAVSSDISPVGEKRGALAVDWKVLSRTEYSFSTDCLVVSWRQSRFAAESFIVLTTTGPLNPATDDKIVLKFFTINAFKNLSGSFFSNSRIVKSGVNYGLFSLTASSVKRRNNNSYSFSLDANRVRGSSANVKAGFLIDACFFVARSKRFRILYSTCKSFGMNSAVAPYFSISSWVASDGGGLGGFPAGAYIKVVAGTIVYDDNGNPTTPDGEATQSRRSRVSISIGLRNPDQWDQNSYIACLKNVALFEHYISVYESIPEAKRTDKQKEALEIDYATLAVHMKRLRLAAEIPVTWVDYTPYIIWKEATFTQMAKVGAGSFSVSMKGSHPNIYGGEEIRVEVDGFRVFGGYVTQIEKSYFFSGKAVPKTILRGTDYNSLFDRLRVFNLRSTLTNYHREQSNYGGYQPPKTYPKGTSDREIILDVVDSHMAPDLPYDLDYSSFVDLVDTPAPVTGWMLPESGSPWRATMQSITTLTNAVFYIDPYKTLHYHDRSKVTAPYAITDGVGGISCRDLVITSDASQMKNDVLVWGTLARTVSGEIMYWRETDDGKASQRYWKSKVDTCVQSINRYKQLSLSRSLTAKEQDAYRKNLEILPYFKSQLQNAMDNPTFDSVSHYGRFQHPEFRADIHNQSWILRRARSIVSRYSQPIITAQATVFEPGFIAGQVVTVKSNAYGVTANLPIRSVTISFVLSKGPKNGIYYAVPKYDLVMGIDPETGWDIYDYLPFEGINTGPIAK